MTKENYDSISKDYSKLIKIDPCKQYVQIPEALRFLGDLKEKSVLDIGCGEGLLSRMMTKLGAKVTGYDVSKEQIKLANKEEGKNPLKIHYLVSNPFDIEDKLNAKFDLAISVLVLHYAKDNVELEKFFSSTLNLLKPEGKFVIITFNPNYRGIGVPRYNRLIEYEGDEKMKVSFLNTNGGVKFSAPFTRLSIKDYEKSCLAAGGKFQWVNLKINEEGKRKMGEDFWKEFEEGCYYIGLIVTR